MTNREYCQKNWGKPRGSGGSRKQIQVLLSEQGRMKKQRGLGAEVWTRHPAEFKLTGS